jgi:hypothetical protein
MVDDMRSVHRVRTSVVCAMVCSLCNTYHPMVFQQRVSLGFVGQGENQIKFGQSYSSVYIPAHV